MLLSFWVLAVYQYG
uniref:Uncharacterized protein n=1 Tax=Arundo donax TaxID=35708 RepID=A0A0A9GZT7_ARUDO